MDSEKKWCQNHRMRIGSSDERSVGTLACLCGQGQASGLARSREDGLLRVIRPFAHRANAAGKKGSVKAREYSESAVSDDWS